MNLPYRKRSVFYFSCLSAVSYTHLHNKIEEIEPDEVDLMLLDEIRKNPECHEFVSQEELMKELEMN